MTHHKHMPLLPLALLPCLLIACQKPEPANPGSAATPPAAALAASAEGAAPAGTQPGNTPTPPSAQAVAHAIFNKADTAQSPNSYDVGDGRTAHFLLGHAFELAGRSYYTGFVQNTQPLYGGASPAANPALQLTLSEATFIQPAPATGGESAGEGKPWLLFGASPSLGKTGLMNQPEQLDESRPVLQHRVSENRLLIAVPTQEHTATSRVSRYHLLSFSPKAEQDSPNGWTHLGSIQTGDVNSPWCSSAQNTQQAPCVDASGKLSFKPTAAGAMPEIHVQWQGTVLDESTGEARPVDERDHTTHTFASFSEGYRHK